MSDRSSIEWTDATWNPLVGCEHVSPGCDNCYAARFALRGLGDYAGLAERTEKGVRFTGEIRLRPDMLDQPLRWKRPRRVFVNSMSDLFHSDVPDSFISAVWASMMLAPQHTYQVLTKRPQRMQRLLSDAPVYDPAIDWTDDFYDEPDTEFFSTGFRWWLPAYLGYTDLPLPNVWLGTSIELDKYTFRADHVRQTPAAVRWLSLEPLLGPLPSLDLTGIDWVVVGGESGPGARPMHPDWVRDIRDRCQAAGVAFHFKQWGEWLPVDQGPWPPGSPRYCWVSRTGHLKFNRKGGADFIDFVNNDYQVVRVGKRAAGRSLDGRTWDEYPNTNTRTV